MAVKDEELTRLKEELTTVENSIKNIMQSGQGFRKGGFSGFSVEQAKLSQLRAERSELRAKIATWELYE
jgi:hypothetical protein